MFLFETVLKDEIIHTRQYMSMLVVKQAHMWNKEYSGISSKEPHLISDWTHVGLGQWDILIMMDTVYILY